MRATLGRELHPWRIRPVLDLRHLYENQGVFDAIAITAFLVGGHIVASTEDSESAYVALFCPGKERSPVVSFRFDDAPGDFVWESDSLANWLGRKRAKPPAGVLRRITQRYRRSVWLAYALATDFEDPLPPHEACKSAGALDDFAVEAAEVASDPSVAMYWIWHHALLGNHAELAITCREAEKNAQPLIQKMCAHFSGSTTKVVSRLPPAKRSGLRDPDAWLSELRNRVRAGTRGRAFSPEALPSLANGEDTPKKSIVRSALAKIDTLNTTTVDEPKMLAAVQATSPDVVDLLVAILERTDFAVFSRRIALAAIERATGLESPRFMLPLRRLAESAAVDTREGSRARVVRALSAHGDEATVTWMWERCAHALAAYEADGGVDDALEAASFLVGVVPHRCDAPVVAASISLLERVLGRSTLSRHEAHVLELVLDAMSRRSSAERACALDVLARPWPPPEAPAPPALAKLEERLTSLRRAVSLARTSAGDRLGTHS